MGIASMVIGILAVICGFIPLCGWVALFPAIIGLVLGIVDVALKSKKNMPRASGTAGIVLCSVAIFVIILWTMFFCVSVASMAKETKAQMESQECTNPDGTTVVVTTKETTVTRP